MKTVKNVTCPVCGTFCDDLELKIEDNQIVKVKNACAMGEAKFLSFPNHRLTSPLIRKDGKLVEASLDEAVEKAAQILADASYPLLYGWSCTSCEATRVGLELTEEVGGVADNTSTICHGPSIMGIQNTGMVTCTLGQIRHRADLVIYWGSNPWSAHPRHIERYTAFAEGRFQDSIWRRYIARIRAALGKKKLERATKLLLMKDVSVPPVTGPDLPSTMFRKERKILVVDVRKTRSAEIADYFLQVKPGEDYELLQALRMLVRDEEIDVQEVAGVPVKLLEEIVDVLISCKFGILFFGLGLTMSRGKHLNIEAALALVQELNFRTKFAIMPMRGHYNVRGANVVFTWQTGYPFGVDFSRGYPQYNPGETTAIDILCRGDSDASLVVASDPVAHFPRKAAEKILENPLIVIDPLESPTSMMADVVIPSAIAGVEAEGTAYRMDGVPLPLKKVVEPPENFLSDVEILSRILGSIRNMRSGGT